MTDKKMFKLKNNDGFSLVEVMMTAAIFTFVVGGTYVIFAAGQSSWTSTETNIQLHENLRQAIERIAMELRQSQVGQGQIFDGTGVNGTDVLRFSIPLVCQSGVSVIDANGDVAHWGAPLTWGCTSSSCMDADNDCNTVDYKSIEYRLNTTDLVRRVLNNNNALVREDIFAHNISDFQTTLNGKVITLTVTVQKKSPLNRFLTAQASVNVTLRN